jgi:hypothetical protein
MGTALWVQADDVDYTAEDDRILLGSLYTEGIVEGMAMVGNGSPSVSVAAGTISITDDDAAGRKYLVRFDSATTVPLANGANTIYATVNKTTGAQALVTGAAPSSPQMYAIVGTVAVSGTTVGTITRGTMADLVVANGQYLKLTGGTVTGNVTFSGTQTTLTRLLVPSLLGVGGSDTVPNMPYGARLGSTAVYGRCACRVDKTTSQDILSTTGWSVVIYNRLRYQAISTGMPRTPWAVTNTTTQSRFYAPINGMYLLTASVSFNELTGTDKGIRQSRISKYNSAGAFEDDMVGVRMIATDADDVSGDGRDSACLSALFDMTAGEFLRVEVRHTQGAKLTMSTQNWASFALVNPM